MKKIFVSDIYYTNGIVKLFKALFAKDATVLSAEYPSKPALEAASKELPLSDSNNGVSAKGIDVFFLSAKMILSGNMNLRNMKKKYGVKNAKVVVMSVMGDFLKEVKDKELGGDFFYEKDSLVQVVLRGDSIEKLSEKEKTLLKSFLN